MMKKRFAIVSLFLTLVLLLSGCAQQDESPQWTPLVKGLEWGMSLEEAKEVLQCEDSCKVIEEDGSTILGVTGSYDSVYGVKFEGMALRFMTDDSGIEGYEGLFSISGTCKDEDVDALQTALNETYADFRKTDDSANIQRWESPAMKDLDNAEELQSALEEIVKDLPNMQDFPVVALGAPTVTCQLFLEGDTRGTFQTDAKYQLLYEAIQP